MSGLWGRWERRSDPERIDLYTRWTLYALSLMVVFFGVVAIGQDAADGAAQGTAVPEPSVVLGLLGVLVANVLAGIAVLRAGFGVYLDGAPVPRGWLGVLLGTAVAGVGLTMLAYPEIGEGLGPQFILVALFVAHTLAAMAPLLDTRRLLTCVAVVVASVLVLQTVVGGAGPRLIAVGISLGSVCLALVLSYRASMWMLGVVWEQERTRDLHARLAVAEERLRFSRDLHDVFGRTLSVVTVKSELAAELAERGRPGAAEQMLEVRRIAEEALREVRAVVAGYRGVELPGELAGARAVLRSAGIDVTVEGEHTDLPQATQDALAWVVREAVTNVVRHARPAVCSISLGLVGQVGRQDAVLEITNDGVTGPPGRGSGLTGLGERLLQVGGDLRTEHRGSTFRLVATVPVAPDRGAGAGVGTDDAGRDDAGADGGSDGAGVDVGGGGTT